MNLLNIIQFVQLPFVVIPLFKFVTNKKIMEDQIYQGVKVWFLMFFAFLLQAINIYSIFGVVNDIVGEALWWFVLILILTQTGFLIYLAFFVNINGLKHELFVLMEEDQPENPDLSLKIKTSESEHYDSVKEVSGINNMTKSRLT